MNIREFNKMNMFTSVNSVLQLFKDRISNIPALSDATGRFNEKLAQIAGRDAQYTTAAAGATASKNNAAEALIDLTLRVANALFVLGNNTHNEQLKAECRLTPSDLIYTRELALIKIQRRVTELAKQYATELVAYGIADADLASLAVAVESFRKSREEQQQRLTESRSARGLLYEDMTVADGIIKNEIDPLMKLMKDVDAGFYNQYQAARVIKDLRGRAPKNGKPEVTPEPPAPVNVPVPELAAAA